MRKNENTPAFVRPDGKRTAFNLFSILKWLAEAATEEQVAEIAKIANARVTILKTLQSNEDWL